MLFWSSRVRCSKQLLLRKMACSTGLSEHRNMSLIVSERQEKSTQRGKDEEKHSETNKKGVER